MNKIFLMTLFFIKQSRLVLGHDVRVSNGTAFKCPGPAEIDHLKAGMVRLSDAYCTYLRGENISNEKL
jgi:hypothetical protein